MGMLATEIVLVGIALAAVLFVGAVYARRRAIGHDSDVVVSGYRTSPTDRWRPALVRMGRDTLSVYPLFGWTTRPTRTWQRRTLDLSSAERFEGESGILAVLDQGRGVMASIDGRLEDAGRDRAELALADVHYTALRYWIESSPSAWPF